MTTVFKKHKYLTKLKEGKEAIVIKPALCVAQPVS